MSGAARRVLLALVIRQHAGLVAECLLNQSQNGARDGAKLATTYWPTGSTDSEATDHDTPLLT